MNSKLTVAAFGAHPDDLEAMVFGTLAKYRQKGHDVHIVLATDGKNGRGPLVTKDELAVIRKKEWMAAASHIGAVTHFLGFEDGRVVYDRESYDKVAGVIETIKPDVVFTHYIEDYHADHRAVGRIVLDAAGPVPVFFCDTCMGIGFEPQFYVDITEQQPIKMKALREHSTQNQGDFMAEYTDLQQRFRGAQCGNLSIKYAECFRLYPRCKWVMAYKLLPD